MFNLTRNEKQMVWKWNLKSKPAGQRFTKIRNSPETSDVCISTHDIKERHLQSGQTGEALEDVSIKTINAVVG